MKKLLWIFVAACAITIASCTGSKSNDTKATDSIEVVMDSSFTDSIMIDSVIVEDGDTIGVV